MSRLYSQLAPLADAVDGVARRRHRNVTLTLRALPGSDPISADRTNEKSQKKDRKRESKAAYTVTLTKANVARAEKRGSDLSDLLDWLLARWLG